MTGRARHLRFNRGPRARPNRRGIALIIVLMVTAILTVVVLEFAQSTRINFYIAANIKNGMRAYYLAKSGVQVAAGALLKDGQDNKEDHLYEEWANPLLGYIPISETETVSVTITDESGKFNLNNLVSTGGRVNQFYLETFRRLLENLGFELEIADAVADWVDTDQDALAGGGLEDTVYGYESAVPQRYHSKNGKFLSLAELKLVRGVTQEVFLKLADVCTVYSDRRYNINTIQEPVLAALVLATDPEANGADVAAKVAAFRDEEGNFFEQKTFKKQLQDIGIDPLLVGRISRRLMAASRYFSVDVTANVGSTIKSIHAVIQRTKKSVKLVYFRPGERLRPHGDAARHGKSPGSPRRRRRRPRPARRINRIRHTTYVIHHQRGVVRRRRVPGDRPAS
ncbi:MAG: type II secretion system minor pseudopilin GspK [Deltaproteobacteria bacterium]|nr:type II secretion system minor pseudopilin GspK [Deltaproteobacteria bacterium]